MSSNNININFSLWKFFPLIIFVFSPKIDLVNIPGFWQGIRLDDIVILLYSIYLLISNKFKIYPNLINSKMFGFNLIIFLPYIVFSTLIAKLLDAPFSIIMLLRYCEYITLIMVLNQLNPPKDKIILVFKIYIILNFLIILLQYFDLIGAFTSRGGCFMDEPDSSDRCYNLTPDDTLAPAMIQKSICFFNCGFDKMKNYQPAGTFLNNRLPGITGGSWELSINLAISFFGLYLFEKNLKKLIPYILMILIMMIIGQSRGIIFGFLVGSFFLINDFKKILKIIFFFIIFLSLMYFFNFFNFKEIFNERFLLDYFSLIKLTTSIFSKSLPSADTFTGTGLESMYWRVESWHRSIAVLKEKNYLMLFGAGGNNLYEESLIVRAVTSYGFLGVLFIIYLARKLPFFFIAFLFVTGLTIDLFVSFKIFLFTSLLLMIYFKNKKEVIKR
jgi:hypothetical protein